MVGILRVKTYDSNFKLRVSTKAEGAQSKMIYCNRNHLVEFKEKS